MCELKRPFYSYNNKKNEIKIKLKSYFAVSENEEIRETALKSTIKIFTQSTEAAKKVIEKHALLYLGFISLNTPPQELYGNRPVARTWTEELYKLCLNLVMMLFVEKEGRCRLLFFVVLCFY